AWDQVRHELLAFVERRVEHHDAAEDIVQDVLERVQRADLTAVANIQAWLYRAARNAIIDHYRRRRSVESLDGFDELIGDRAHGELGNEPAAVVRELSRCMRPLVDRLADDYRVAVTLVDLDGYTHHAAAELTGISTSGMKSRVQRGRKKLAGLLQECCVIATTPTGAIADYTPRQGRCPC
ncbi:MAG: sigma-70 family RNA polymerase sigma factor, partial [Acidimicrobiales bacterium]